MLLWRCYVHTQNTSNFLHFQVILTRYYTTANVCFSLLLPIGLLFLAIVGCLNSKKTITPSHQTIFPDDDSYFPPAYPGAGPGKPFSRRHDFSGPLDESSFQEWFPAPAYTSRSDDEISYSLPPAYSEAVRPASTGNAESEQPASTENAEPVQPASTGNTESVQPVSMGNDEAERPASLGTAQTIRSATISNESTATTSKQKPSTFSASGSSKPSTETANNAANTAEQRVSCEQTNVPNQNESR